jgi:hypothetical protein
MLIYRPVRLVIGKRAFINTSTKYYAICPRKRGSYDIPFLHSRVII